ncbi:MAG TPA: head GIN domain-containing protein [Ferruginibacter sp.]|nr:head GIN domain-containing protein [Ferruginibacter sp.]
MKKILLICCVFLIQLATNAQKKFVVDANAELRSVTDNYNAIKVSGGIDLFLSQSDERAIAVSATNNNAKDGIKTVVEDGQLHIYYDGDKLLNKKNLKLRVYVSIVQLKKIEVSGACDVFVIDSLQAHSLTLQLSGSSDFKGIVNTTNLDVDLSGASDVFISGIASKVNVKCTGASDVHGYGLVTDFCTINASGASDITITVNKELNAKASGASNIFYKGNGELKQNESGHSSSIEKKNR